jgi:hypothetical protein
MSATSRVSYLRLSESNSRRKSGVVRVFETQSHKTDNNRRGFHTLLTSETDTGSSRFITGESLR